MVRKIRVSDRVYQLHHESDSALRLGTSESISAIESIVEMPVDDLDSVEALPTPTYKDGLEDGQQAATEELRERWETGLEGLLETAGLLNVQAKEVFAKAEEEMVSLCFEIARGVVGDVAMDNPEVVKTAVADALGRIKGEEIVLRLHPVDVAAVRPELARLCGNMEHGSFVKINEDPTIERGGCVLESKLGTVDTQPTVKLRQLHDGLHE